MFDPKIVASNIKKQRAIHCLTQSKLAELVNVSIQAVSKWECGTALPDLPKLYMLAELFAVSVDELLGSEIQATHPKMMIGIVVGDFVTEFLLFDNTGTIRGRRLLAGGNPNDCGVEKCCETLKTGIDTLVGAFAQISGIFVGLTGAEEGDNKSEIAEFLMQAYSDAKVAVSSDIQTVMACFPELEKAAFVTCDTSACVYARNGKETHRFGGWGHRLERAGSILAIGRDALTAVLMAADESGDSTLLTEYIEEHFGKTLEQCLTHIYREDADTFANFAPYVFEAYRRGDKEAERILERNMGYIAHLVQRAEEKCDCNHTVVLSSYLQSYQDSMIEILERMDLKGYQFVVSDFPQIYGACLCCASLCGVEDEIFRESFKIKYQQFRELLEQ